MRQAYRDVFWQIASQNLRKCSSSLSLCFKSEPFWQLVSQNPRKCKLLTNLMFNFLYGDYLENDFHRVNRKLGLIKSINSVEVIQILWKIWTPKSHYSNVLEIYIYTYGFFLTGQINPDLTEALYLLLFMLLT